jgi:predicted DNA-binding ribbon-helix-helix protein
MIFQQLFNVGAERTSILFGEVRESGLQFGLDPQIELYTAIHSGPGMIRSRCATVYYKKVTRREEKSVHGYSGVYYLLLIRNVRRLVDGGYLLQRFGQTQRLTKHGPWERDDRHMKTSIVKRSIVLGGHKTSVSLEDAFWKGLKGIAKVRRKTLGEMVSDIDASRDKANLSSAIRLFVLYHYIAGGEAQLGQVGVPDLKYKGIDTKTRQAAN